MKSTFYGVDSLFPQVTGILVEWLSGLPDDVRKTIEDLIYDDNCHLARYVLKLGKNIADNEVTQQLAKMRKSIDKFHFGNHVDMWCKENCNPYDVKALDNVNTEVCEQQFNHINKHRNVKAMNQPNFFLFWLYILDLHNLMPASRTRGPSTGGH